MVEAPSRSGSLAATPTLTPLSTGGRIPALDGARALAVLSVFILHCTLLADFDLSDLGWVDRVWTHITFLNGTGPLLFFALSGFLITNILLKSKEKPRYFRNFYARRALRILPLYYAVLIFCMLVLPGIPSFLETARSVAPSLIREDIPGLVDSKIESYSQRVGNSAWMYWVLLHNWAIAFNGWRHAILDVTWSVAVEEQFYFFWPALVLLCSRRTLIRICFACLIFALLFRSYLVFVLHTNPIMPYVLTPARLGSPAMGCLLALIWKDETLLQRLKRPCIVAAVCLLPAIWGINLLDIVKGWDYRGEFGVRGGPLGRSLGDTVVAIGLFSLLVCCLTVSPGTLFQRFMSSRPLALVAKYSYGIFLFHLPIRAVIRDTLYGTSARGLPKWKFLEIGGSMLPGQLIFYVLAFVPTFILAALSWHLLEKRFVDLKKRYRDEPKPTTTERPEPVTVT